MVREAWATVCLLIAEAWLPALGLALLAVLAWLGEAWLLGQLGPWWRLVMRAGS